MLGLSLSSPIRLARILAKVPKLLKLRHIPKNPTVLPIERRPCPLPPTPGAPPYHFLTQCSLADAGNGLLPYTVDVIEKASLKYIAGYVAYRFRNQFPFLGTPTELLINSDNDWISHISRGKLISPCIELFETAKIMEKVFHDYHSPAICKEPWLFKNLVSKIINLQDKNCLIIP